MLQLPPELLAQLLSGGTVGLILVLLLALSLFLSGRVRRGAEAEEWKETAQTSTQALAGLVPTQEATARALEELTEAVQKLTAMAELKHREADLRREMERQPPRSRRP